ncbi:hypothetical protein OG470_19630 [Micromonospora sp. NBC_00389]|uniref:hypothetical protein n=1 Tax=Micromonospora sp. NBC_00389 TaxID=2903586 RepID=UPI002E1B03E0
MLDRAALLDALSVLTTNTPAPTTGYPMPTPIGLDRLNYGDLAIAIYAAGIPAKADALTVEQIKALAVAGIAHLGVAEIYRINEQWRTVNRADCDKVYRDGIRRLWGSARREDTAVGLGYRLKRAIERGQVTA